MKWPRRNQGFEWHQYVRTTVKLRREERRQKIEEIREAAIEGARQAGRQGMAAGRHGVDAGRHGLIASRYRLARWAGRVGRGLGVMLAAAGRSTGRALRAGVRGMRGVLGRLAGLDWRMRGPALSTRAKISGLFGGLAVLAGASSLMQVKDVSGTWPAVLAGLVALVLSGIAVAPWAGSFLAQRRSAGDWFAGMRFSSTDVLRPLGFAALVAGVVVIGSGTFWFLGEGAMTSSITTASIGRVGPPLPKQAPAFTVPVPETLSGRARAVSGDTIDVGGRIVRLSDVEAVEVSQVCRDARGRAWRCGQRARRVLGDLINRREVQCSDLARSGPSGFEGTCRAGGKDLAKAVVAAGYAFAEGFFFRSYGDAEDVARAAKRGIWQGEVERPADYRADRWARAKAKAPDGCPIKGQVSRRVKTYVVPWAPDYGRVRVRRARGERWFCSEADAAAAGFVPAI